jgi:hypothetical protein
MKLHVLLDAKDWQQLLDEEELNIFKVGAVLDNPQLSMDQFLKIQELDKQALIQGLDRDTSAFALTKDREAIELISAGDKKIARPLWPCIMVRPMQFHVTSENEILAQSLSKDNADWGHEVIYPQLFEHPQSKEHMNALTQCTNGSVFGKWRRWVRMHSKPVVIQAGKNAIRSTFRIGSNAENWGVLLGRVTQKNWSVNV